MNAKLRYVGENVRQARQNKNLTISALAELINVSDSYLGTAERGTSGFSIDIIIRLSKALDISTDSLLLENQPETLTATNQETLSALLTACTSSEIDFLIEYVHLCKKQGFFKKSNH